MKSYVLVAMTILSFLCQLINYCNQFSLEYYFNANIALNILVKFFYAQNHKGGVGWHNSHTPFFFFLWYIKSFGIWMSHWAPTNPDSNQVGSLGLQNSPTSI